MPDYDKLLDILQRLKDMRWNVRDFLSTSVNNSGRHKVRRAQTQFLDFAYMNLAYAESYGFLGIAIVAPPPPNLLLNPDILDILKPSTLY